jgi:lipopolysaccharide export system protein LptC
MAEVSGDIDWPTSAPVDAPVRPKNELGDVLDLTESPWRGAFKAAGRHSARVRFLRRGIIVLCVAAVSMVAIVALFDPFRRLPRNLSIGQVRVEGTRITVESPKIEGFQKDGRPYEVTARAGVQDTTTPNTVELHGIDAKIGLNDASTLQVTAEHGTYDSLHDHMILDGSANIKNDTGYSILMKTAEMDFKTGALVSKDPVNVILKSGTVAANQMGIENDGKISFVGAVKSVIESGGGELATAVNPVALE